MFIDHVVVKQSNGVSQGAPRPGLLYEVVYAANGVWIRAQREGLAAQIPHVIYTKPIPGLRSANLVVQVPERVKPLSLNWLIEKSRENLPNEELFYLVYQNGWRVIIPDQVFSIGSCRPRNPYGAGPERATIEVHSHNSMSAHFSSIDDEDEKGFRIYVILGRLNKPRPEIAVRVGIYGFRAMVPANLVFQLPGYLGVDDVFDELC